MNSELSINNQLIELKLKLNNRSEFIEKINTPTSFFFGVEPSGNLHLGHFTLLLLQKQLLDAGLKGHFLFADMHLKLEEKKNANLESYKNIIHRFFKGYDVTFYDDKDIKFRPNFLETLLNLSTKINLSKIKKLLPKPPGGLPIEGQKLSKVLYALMQIIDAPLLNVDLVVSGIDQRRFYAAMIDYTSKIDLKCPSVFMLDLLKMDDGLKMSSSRINMPLTLILDGLRAKTPDPILFGEFKTTFLAITRTNEEQYLETLEKELARFL